jgi:hypothetical protein
MIVVAICLGGFHQIVLKGEVDPSLYLSLGTL